MEPTDTAEVVDAVPASAVNSDNEAETHTADQDKEGNSPVAAQSNAGGANVDYGSWEFEPPLANIRRLLKPILSKGTNISKDSVTALSRASGIFVLYLSNCATDVAREGKRTTIAAKDVMAALKELDLEDFIPEMEQFLVEHRKYERSKKDEKDRIKRLHGDNISGGFFGNKKGVRGADGKYVGTTATGSKEYDKDDFSDDENEKAEDAPAQGMTDDSSTKHDIGHDNLDIAAKKRKLEHDEGSYD